MTLFKANNKYMKCYDKNKESSYLKQWDANNLFGWAMSQKLPVTDFKWVEDISQFNEYFRKSYNDKSDESYFFKIDIQYPKDVHNLHNNSAFLPEIMKNEKVGKNFANAPDKGEHVIHIRNLKQTLNLGLALKKFIETLKLIKSRS